MNAFYIVTLIIGILLSYFGVRLIKMGSGAYEKSKGFIGAITGVLTTILSLLELLFR